MNEDLSSLFEKFNINKDSISPEMVDSLMGMLNSKDNNSKTESSNNMNIDMDTIMMMKSIMDKMNNNKDNPRSKLLLSLKPYLKESRKSKIDQYIQLSKLIEILPLMGGDSKDARK